MVDFKIVYSSMVDFYLRPRERDYRGRPSTALIQEKPFPSPQDSRPSSPPPRSSPAPRGVKVLPSLPPPKRGSPSTPAAAPARGTKPSAHNNENLEVALDSSREVKIFISSTFKVPGLKFLRESKKANFLRLVWLFRTKLEKR
jgi:hypothetical protein